MRIVLYASAFNSLSQTIAVRLGERGHDLAVALDLGGGPAGAQELRSTVDRHQPDLVIAPMLTTAIPEDIWTRLPCLIVHPGPPGDRGPSSLDWAMASGVRQWGVTVLQAVAEMDAGPIWAWQPITIPENVTKGALYRGEVSDAAQVAVLRAVDRFAAGEQPDPAPDGRARPYYPQTARQLDWTRDTTAAVSLALRTADSSPGVLDDVNGTEYYVYGGTPESTLTGTAGAFLATRDGAVCRATSDGAVWITSARPRRVPAGPPTIKAPAATVLRTHLADVPEIPAPLTAPPTAVHTHASVTYREHGAVGYLDLDLPSGALTPADCRRLRDALLHAGSRPTRVLVLGAIRSMLSGIHLGFVESQDDPAAASWDNITAIDDVVEQVMATTRQITVAAIGSGAAAGGLMLALACDETWARSSVALAPNYLAMDLYGSELWTLNLPRRVGTQAAARLTSQARPMGAAEALALGLIDRAMPANIADFEQQVLAAAHGLAADPAWSTRLHHKRTTAYPSEVVAAHRRQELARMHDIFFNPEARYHALRRAFMHKTPADATPEHLRDLPAALLDGGTRA